MYISKPIDEMASSLRKFKEIISYKDILGIILGAFIIALAIQLVLVPVHMLTGGVSGISIILKFLTGVDIWIWYIVLNIPIFIIGYKFISKRFALYSLLGMLALTFFLGICKNWQVDLGYKQSLAGGHIGGSCKRSGRRYHSAQQRFYRGAGHHCGDHQQFLWVQFRQHLFLCKSYHPGCFPFNLEYRIDSFCCHIHLHQRQSSG